MIVSKQVLFGRFLANNSNFRIFLNEDDHPRVHSLRSVWSTVGSQGPVISDFPNPVDNTHSLASANQQHLKLLFVFFSFFSHSESSNLRAIKESFTAFPNSVSAEAAIFKKTFFPLGRPLGDHSHPSGLGIKFVLSMSSTII